MIIDPFRKAPANAGFYRPAFLKPALPATPIPEVLRGPLILHQAERLIQPCSFQGLQYRFVAAEVPVFP